MQLTTKTERLFQLLSLLRSNPDGLTAAEIAARLDIHRRTAVAYINELSSIAPIYEDGNRFGILPDVHFGLVKTQTISLDLPTLIAQGEGELLEFKVSACWDRHQKTKNPSMMDNVLKAVAGFMNGKLGGMLLVGITDDGKVVGLVDDYRVANKNKPNRDGYHLFLRDSINDNLGSNNISFYSIGFQEMNGVEICWISVKPATNPVYFRGAMFVRNGNETRQFTTQEAVGYIKQRWM